MRIAVVHNYQHLYAETLPGHLRRLLQNHAEMGLKRRLQLHLMVAVWCNRS